MKKVKLKSESGRSMVEMLGVLAIIGVLSVGGIAGYKTAMERKTFNDAAELIRLLDVAVRESEGQNNNIFWCDGNFRYNVEPQTTWFAQNFLGVSDPQFPSDFNWTDFNGGLDYKNFFFYLAGGDFPHPETGEKIYVVSVWLNHIPVSTCKQLVDGFYDYLYDDWADQGGVYHHVMWHKYTDGIEAAKTECETRAQPDGKTVFNIRIPYYPTEEHCLVDKP